MWEKLSADDSIHAKDTRYDWPSAFTKVAAIDGAIANLSISPEGRRIAFVGTFRGTPIRSYSQPDLLVVVKQFRLH